MPRKERVLSYRKGFTLIELLIVIAVMIVLTAIAIPNLPIARELSNETSAVGSVRTIHSAEASYRLRYPAYGALTSLAGASLIDPSLGAGVKSGYQFTVYQTTGDTFYVLATPTSPGSSGSRQFYVDQSGIIYAASAASNPPITDSFGAAPNPSFLPIPG